MKSTLADNKQLFNVKAITTAGKDPDQIAEGEFAVIDEATGKTVVPANFEAFPERAFFVSKLGGKVYYSFDTIEKEKIKNLVAVDYQAPQINIWEGIIENCRCIKNVQLNLGIDEASLMQRDGLTWTHMDSIVEVSPQELSCYCDCSGEVHKVYENNVMTMLLAKKVNENESAFYEAEVINTEDDSVITDVEAFVEANKARNTGNGELDEEGEMEPEGPMLKLRIKGKPYTEALYNDLEVNYVYPRGTKLHPAISIDGKVSVQFEEIQELVYELGSGYDLRAEEWENINYYTNLNHYTRLSDGIQSQDLVYQFENGVKYNTVTFEFFTDKVERNNGDKRLFGVLLGTSVSGVYTSLKNMFGL